MSVKENHYQFLGLDISATPQEVRAEVEAMTRQAHNMVYTAPERAHQLRERLRDIKGDLLSGDERREAYDLSLLRDTTSSDPSWESEPASVAEEPPPIVPFLGDWIVEDWPDTMPSSPLVTELRRLVDGFQESMARYDRDEAATTRRFVGDDADQNSVEEAGAHRSAAQATLTHIHARLEIGRATALLDEEEASPGPYPPAADPGGELRGVAGLVQHAGQRIDRTLSSPLFRLRSWQIWVLLVLVVGASMAVLLLAGLGQPGVVGAGITAIVVVCLLAFVRLRHWSVLQTSLEQARAGAMAADYWHGQLLHSIEERETATARERAECARALDELNSARAATVAECQAAIDELTEPAGYAARAWDAPAWHEWEPAPANSDIVRLGSLRASEKQGHLILPALLDLPGSHNLLLRAAGSPRAVTHRALRSIVLRLLATYPPDSMQLVLIDPDFSEQRASLLPDGDALGLGRFVGEPEAIEAALDELSAYVNDTIDAHLRGRYSNINQFQAAEGVSLPYRVLVATGFPRGFTEPAARRLANIASVGPACGVYVILAADDEMTLPPGFTPDIRRRAFTEVSWNGTGFTWQDRDFGSYRLALDAPPPQELTRQIVGTLAERVETVNRETRSFMGIAASPEKSWGESSTLTGISIAVGRSENRRPYQLQLDAATGHALIAGSADTAVPALLASIALNGALTYAPAELALYLIDFEGAPGLHYFADSPLPHFRLVSRAPEREYGLSVLESLTDELDRRLACFEEAGVTTMSEYRAESPVPMPRIVASWFAFETLFAGEDAIAQQAGIQLNRLLKAGAPAGIHLVLASQRLGRAYSAVRDLVPRIGVRLAFRSSEADSRLMLGNANDAAAGIKESDTAIANNVGGTIDRNMMFGLLSLADEERDSLQARIRVAAQSEAGESVPTVVYRGDESPNLESSWELDASRAKPLSGEVPLALPIWLGEPPRVGARTVALLRRQSRANLLVAGAEGEAALGVLESSMLTAGLQLAGNRAAGLPRFSVLDFTPVDAPYAGRLAQFCRRPALDVVLGGRRELPEMLGALAGELERRLSSGTTETPLFLVIFGLQRAHGIRVAESGETPAAAQQMHALLQEGPDVGIHTLVWVDSTAAFDRMLGRAALGEFDLRVVFQLTPEDSRVFIERSSAARLTGGRALLYGEEDNRLESFRPYGRASDRWLDSLPAARSQSAYAQG